MAFLYSTILELSPTPPVVDSEITKFTEYVNNPRKYTPIPQHENMTHISIDMDSPLDMNWTGMLTVNNNDVPTTPAAEQIVLPFLHKYPINNLNIKFDATIMRF